MSGERIGITEEVMEKINGYAVGELKSEQVYCFSVLLCDNDVDRDYERFSDEALDRLMLTLFYRLMPELIYEGHVYIAMPPLYKAIPSRGG